MRKFLSYLTAVTVLFAATSCLRSNSWRECNGGVWNTTYHIVYKADRDLEDSVQACFRRVAHSVSAFDSGSTVSRINRNETVMTDSAFRTVFRMAKKINAESDRLFDPTLSPVINLWGYGYTGRHPEIPEDSAIAKALLTVGIADCHLKADGTVAKKSPHTEFNFSALAKGFGCDEIGRMLQRQGCSDYMIEIGGEIAVHGINPHHRPWYILIDAPVDNDSVPQHVAMRTIRVTDCGVATSGNYRNYRDTPQGRTSHTIDPNTGYPTTFQPTDTLIISATVIAPSTMEADALATACMCMHPTAALRMVGSAKGRSALLVIDTRDGKCPQIIQTKDFPQSET